MNFMLAKESVLMNSFCSLTYKLFLKIYEKINLSICFKISKGNDWIWLGNLPIQLYKRILKIDEKKCLQKRLSLNLKRSTDKDVSEAYKKCKKP